MAHIGRLQAVGIAYETVAGTKKTAVARIPKTSGIIKPVVETIKNTSGYGVIDELYESDAIREHTEIDLEGILSNRFIGFLLLGTLGASSVTGAGPYTHAFTVKNDNAHPTFTVWGKDPVTSTSTAYSMVEEFGIEATAGEYVKYNVKMIGKKQVSETPPTPAYSSTDWLFRARDVKVYFSDTEGSRGTAISCDRIKLTINKNLYTHQELGSVDLTSIYNQQLTVSGDMELLYEAVTMQDYVRNGTNKFMKIEIINTGVTMTPSGNPTLIFTLGKTVFETWDTTNDNNGLVKQTIGFSGAYNNTATYTIKASLINENTADYDA